MPLQVIPATEADAARAMAIEDRAFGPNPISMALFPGQAHKLDGYLDSMVEQLRTDPACRWMKVVDTDLAAMGQKDMIAFSRWLVWEEESSPPTPRKWGPGTVPEGCELFFGGQTRKWWERFQGKPHIYLKNLQTDPDHQRRGAGGMLVKWGADEADRLGLVAYLEATAEGRPLYEKYGFREVDRLVVDLSKWGGPSSAESVMMLRQPRQQA